MWLLAAVRGCIASLLSPEFNESERLHHFDIGPSILDELDSLIDEFGGTALAIDFVQVLASEPHSRVIEVMAKTG